MLTDLRIQNLGVIENAEVEFESGLIAITGETGAGKTMVVSALNLLAGSRSDASIVRVGKDTATVEARFELNGEETVVRRVVSSNGRSKAYVNGAMATIKELAEVASKFFVVHGQHEQVRLFSPKAQRSVLDNFAGVDTSHIQDLQKQLKDIDSEISELGGEPEKREREIDLLSYQLREIEEAEILDSEEDLKLQKQEEFLASISTLQEQARRFSDFVHGDKGAGEVIAESTSVFTKSEELRVVSERLQALLVEIQDITSEVDRTLDEVDDAEAKLDQLQQRRAVLATLRRKYGAELADVISYREETRHQLEKLKSHDSRLAELALQRESLLKRIEKEQNQIGQVRRKAAPKLAKLIQENVGKLALSGARFEIELSEEPYANEISFQFSANAGLPVGPLAKIASGGELSRTMLAIYMSTGQSDQEPTVVFDEVDAGVGGNAAISVGRALASVGTSSQVIVVTHLPQVAAFAEHQLNIEKSSNDEITTSSIRQLNYDDRVIELTRMMSGQPESSSGQSHAVELLDLVSEERKSLAS